jgi:hypothetical protein
LRDAGNGFGTVAALVGGDLETRPFEEALVFGFLQKSEARLKRVRQNGAKTLLARFVVVEYQCILGGRLWQ